MRLVCLPLLLAAASSCVRPRPSSSTDSPSRALRLAELVVEDTFANAPERVARLRPPRARYDMLPDESLPAVEARRQREDGWLAEIGEMGGAALMADRAASLALELARAHLEARRDARLCRRELWDVSQASNGWHIRLSDLAQAQPVGTDELRAQALARFSAVPRSVEVRLDNLREGLRLGYSASSVNVAAVIEQLDALLAQARRAIGRAQAALPRAVHLFPRAAVALEPIPAFQDKSAAAHYLAAALDGSRPAEHRVRLYQAEKQSRALGESTAFHETLPGHHLQIAIASEREGLPEIARFLFFSGHVEGWALYAERLADELGLYGGDLDRLGQLSNEAFRAVRLVVDTGLHARGWPRQRALDFMLAHTANSQDQSDAEINRYIAWPGQATSYMVGMLEIRALREEAQRELGPRFDLRTFHDRVLENGGVSLPILRRQVRDWIASERRRS